MNSRLSQLGIACGKWEKYRWQNQIQRNFAEDYQERHKAFKDLAMSSIFAYQRDRAVPTYQVSVTVSVFLIKMLGKYFVFGLPLHILNTITGFKAGSALSIYWVNAFYWYHIFVTTDPWFLCSCIFLWCTEGVSLMYVIC